MNSDQIRPLGDKLLVEHLETPQTTESGIHVVSGSPQYERGRLKAVGGGVQSIASASDLKPGAMILFVASGKIPLTGTSTHFLLPYDAVVAVLDDALHIDQHAHLARFFTLSDWKTVEAKRDVLRDHGTVRDFTFIAGFLEPFRDLESLARTAHEVVVSHFSTIPEVRLGGIKFKKVAPSNEPVQFLIEIEHDIWDGGILISKNAIRFIKQKTTFSNLYAVLPTWLHAFARILRTDDFRLIAGYDYSRLAHITITLKQHFRLEGRGRSLAAVRNSEVMREFLRYDPQQGEKTKQTLMQILTPNANAIRRIDLKIGFEQEIAGTDYLLFVGIEAPANEDLTHLDVDWEIQDHDPAPIGDRDYGKVFEEFFVQLVARRFYKQWLDEIASNTTF